MPISIDWHSEARGALAAYVGQTCTISKKLAIEWKRWETCWSI